MSFVIPSEIDEHKDTPTIYFGVCKCCGKDLGVKGNDSGYCKDCLKLIYK